MRPATTAVVLTAAIVLGGAQDARAQLKGHYIAGFTGLENGSLKPVIAKEFPLAEAAKAHVAVMDSGALGKIVLVP